MTSDDAAPATGGEEEDALPDFLRFEPVPVRPRHDGWSPALQRRFVVELALGAGVEEAARRVGRSAQGAYRLRRRRGAEGFAAAWDKALAFAAEARVLGRQAGALPGLAPGSGIEMLLVPRFYRGRLVGYVMREDVRGAMAVLRRLDRVAERVEREAPRPDAGFPLGLRWKLRKARR